MRYIRRRTGTAKGTPDKSGRFSIPVSIVNSGRKSDVTLSGDFTKQPDGLAFSGRLVGDTIFVGDLQLLAGLIPPGEATPAQTSPSSDSTDPRDEKPFWSGVDGSFDIAIKKLIQDPTNPITDLKAKAVVNADKVALEQFSGNASGGSVSASATLAFATKERQPYSLQGSFKVPGFDVGAYFKAADPGNPPELETVVTADGTFNARGVNLDDLVSRVQGNVELKGGKGVYRGLARTSGVVSTASSILGAFVKDQRVQVGTQVVTELADALRELKFDQMTVKATRGADLKLNIDTFDLRSPSMHLTGSGFVEMKPQIPLAKQSQNFTMQLGFKDRLAERMAKGHLTESKKDALGYSLLRIPIKVSGTLMAPDTREFWEGIGKSALDMGIQGFFPGG